MNSKNILLFIILLTALCVKLNAQIVTDRPNQTENSSTVPKGALQFEGGILIGYEEDNQINKRQALLPINLFRYGITDWIELRFVNQLKILKINGKQFDGIGDLEVGTKIQLLKKENLKTEIAFISQLIIPTGTKQISIDRHGTLNKLSISHKITEDFGIAYNIGYNYFGQGNGNLTYSLAFGIGVSEKLGIYIENYGEAANLDKFISSFDTGLTYLANNNLQLDFTFGSGINQSMNYISIGCSWLIEKK